MIFCERYNPSRAGRIRHRRIYALMHAVGYFSDAITMDGDRGNILNWFTAPGFAIPLGRVPNSGDTENIDGQTCATGTTGALFASGVNPIITGGSWAATLSLTGDGGSGASLRNATVGTLLILSGGIGVANSSDPGCDIEMHNASGIVNATIAGDVLSDTDSFLNNGAIVNGVLTADDTYIYNNCQVNNAASVLTDCRIGNDIFQANDGSSLGDGVSVIGGKIQSGGVSLGSVAISGGVDMSVWAGTQTGTMTLKGVVNICDGLQATPTVDNVDGSGGSSATTVTAITNFKVKGNGTGTINVKLVPSAGAVSRARVQAGM